VKDDGSSSQHVFDILHEPDNKEISDLSQISEVGLGDLSLEMNQESPIVKDNGSTSKEESNIKVNDAVQKKNGSTSNEEIKKKVVDDEVQKRNDSTSKEEIKKKVMDDEVQKRNDSTSPQDTKMKVVDDEVQKRNDTTSPQDTKITVDDVVDVHIAEVEKEAIEALGKLKLDKSPMSVKMGRKCKRTRKKNDKS